MVLIIKPSPHVYVKPRPAPARRIVHYVFPVLNESLIRSNLPTLPHDSKKIITHVVGLDMSLRCTGLAKLDLRREVYQCTRVSQKGRSKGWTRNSTIIEAIESWFLSQLPSSNTLVLLEDYAYGKRSQRGHIDRAELIGVVKEKLISRGFVTYLVSPTSLKLFIALYGRAEKSEVITNVELQTGIIPKDDNEADALALVLYGRALLLDKEPLEFQLLS